MALVVRADVVDLRTDMPKPTDSFLVDTNVWYWLTYPRASQTANPPAYYQTRYYPNYMKSVRKTGAQLLYCGTVFAELAHRIESDEHKFFSANQGMVVSGKDFRHNYPQERQDVQDEVAIAWGQVTAMASIAPVPLDDATVTASAILFGQVCLDGYDLITVEAMRQSGSPHIITDDKDFLTVPGIVVLTANNNAIGAAQSAGKLLKR
jgi:hypothetical protein